jgi:hypothetical protein
MDSRTALAAVLATLAIVVAYYYYAAGSGSSAGASSTTAQDGSSLSFSCGGAAPGILKATYGPPAQSSAACASADVTAFLQTWAESNAGGVFAVGPDAFGSAAVPSCAGVRELAVNYQCPSVGAAGAAGAAGGPAAPAAAGCGSAARPGSVRDRHERAVLAAAGPQRLIRPGEADSETGDRGRGRYYFQPPVWSPLAAPPGGPYRPLADCRC